MRPTICGLSGLLVLVLGGCAGLQEFAQGTADQLAASDEAQRAATAFQVPEDALAYRDHQLTELLQLLGQTIARSYQPKARVTVVAGNREDAEWLVATLQDGIRRTGWSLAAVIWPVDLRVSAAYPRITVIESAPEERTGSVVASPADKALSRLAAVPSQPRPLTEPLSGVRYVPPAADLRVTMLDPVSPESRDHLATLRRQLARVGR